MVKIFQEVSRVYFYCSNLIFLFFLLFFTMNLDHQDPQFNCCESFIYYFYYCMVSFIPYLDSIFSYLTILSYLYRLIYYPFRHLYHYLRRLLFVPKIINRYLFIKSINPNFYYQFVVTFIILLLHHHPLKSQPNSLFVCFLPYLKI